MNKPTQERINPELLKQKFDHNWYIDTLFDGCDGNVERYFLGIYEVLGKKVDLFTSDQKIKYSSLYKQIVDLVFELRNTGNDYANNYMIKFSPTAEYNKEGRQNFMAENGEPLKKLLKRAILLNQICIENYGITTADEILKIEALKYIKQITTYIINHKEELKIQESKESELCFESESNESGKIIVIAQSHETNFLHLGLDPNLIYPYAPSVTNTILDYIDEEKSLEANIIIGRGYQAIASGFEDDENNNTSLEESLIKNLNLVGCENKIYGDTIETLRAINLIARELEIPLKLS